MPSVTQDVPRPVLENQPQNLCRRIDSTAILPMTLGGVPVEEMPDVWHVAIIKRGEERAFVSDLIRYGQPFFIPWEIVHTRYENKWTRVSQRAPFKGYCFLSGDDSVDIARQRCRGFFTTMKDMRGDAVQAQIRRDVFNLYRLYLTDPDFKPPILGKGVMVQVTDRSHALYGVTGRVIQHESGRRLVVEFRTLGDLRAVDIEDELAVEVVE
jgi:hypothetical protein